MVSTDVRKARPFCSILRSIKKVQYYQILAIDCSHVFNSFFFAVLRFCFSNAANSLLFDVSTTSTTTGNAERARLQKEGKLQCVTRKEPATAAQSVTGSQLSPPPR